MNLFLKNLNLKYFLNPSILFNNFNNLNLKFFNLNYFINPLIFNYKNFTCSTSNFKNGLNSITYINSIIREGCYHSSISTVIGLKFNDCTFEKIIFSKFGLIESSSTNSIINITRCGFFSLFSEWSNMASPISAHICNSITCTNLCFYNNSMYVPSIRTSYGKNSYYTTLFQISIFNCFGSHQCLIAADYNLKYDQTNSSFNSGWSGSCHYHPSGGNEINKYHLIYKCKTSNTISSNVQLRYLIVL